MAFEPNFEEVATSYRLRLGTTQAIIECKLPANEDSEISKVLSANAKAYVNNTNVSEGEIEFSGFVNFLVSYETDMSTQSLDYSAEFKEKFKNNQIMLNDQASVVASVVDVNTTKVPNTNSVAVVAVVEISVDVIKTKHTPVLVGATGDDVFVKTDNLTVMALHSNIVERFELMEEFEIKDSVLEVLNVSAQAFLETITPNDGYLSLRGGVDVIATYLTNIETPEIRTYQTSFNFSQEIADGAVEEDSNIQSNLNTLYNELEVNTKLGDDSTVISLNQPLQYNGFVFNENDVEVVEDIFSTQNEVKVKTSKLKWLNNMNTATFAEKISGNVVTDESTPFIDEVLGSVCNNVVLASSHIEKNELVVEGIAYTTVLYFNKEFETNNSLEVEIPFSFNLPAENINENTTPIVSVALTDVITRSKRGTEIDVTAIVMILAEFYELLEEAVITELEIGEEKGESDCVLSVYIVSDGDTLWSIAKELNISPEALMDQNPQIELPLTPGEKLIVYRQKEVAF